MSARVFGEADLLGGFEDARERFDVARTTGRREPGFRALFETLSWVVSLDELIAVRLGDGWWGQTSGGRVVRAVRFARNRVHHQWAEAVSFDVIGVIHADTVFSADTLIAASGDTAWRWRPVSTLPPPDPDYPDPKGERFYDELLAGEPSQNALAALSGVFARVV